MKIMFLAGTYWPDQDGVSHVTQYLAEGLAKRHEVLVMSQLKPAMESNEEHNGVRIERIHVQRNPYWQCVQGDKKQARERVKQYQPDVLIAVCVQNWGYDWFKKDLDRFPGKKVLMTHGCSCLREYRIMDKVKSLRIRRRILADLLDVYHEWYGAHYKQSLIKDMEKYNLTTYLYEEERLHQYAKQHGLNKDVILENATEDFFFDRKAYLVDNEKKTAFINVSNYEELKNQKKILEAFYEADLPNARLDLIGSRENDYLNQLRDLNKKMRIQHGTSPEVNIWVGLSRQQVLEVYRNADIYVCASDQEVMSISLCEAAAGGLTILSTNVGHAAQIPGIHLFKTKDELVQLMKRIYDNPDLRKTSGKKAYEFAYNRYRTQDKVEVLEMTLQKMCD